MCQSHLFLAGARVQVEARGEGVDEGVGDGGQGGGRARHVLGEGTHAWEGSEHRTGGE